MTSREMRLFSRLSNPTSSRAARDARNFRAWLTRRVGKAFGTVDHNRAEVDRLEERKLLEGSFLSPLALPAADAAGVIVTAGNINPALPSTNNDTYTFTATASGFVTVLGDTANESPASNLDTRVQVFNSAQQLIASGTTNGTLTTGVQRDGWAGFVAQAGQQYFFVVSSEGAAQGTYQLRVQTTNHTFDIEGGGIREDGIARELGSPEPDQQPTVPAPPPDLNATAIVGQLGGTGPIPTRTRQDEILYKWVVPSAAKWDSLVVVNAQTTQTDLDRRLDTRVEIYNASGQLITSDSDTGRLRNAYTAFKATPGATFYIRVRSDVVLNRANPTDNTSDNTSATDRARTHYIEKAAGPFYLVMDALAQDVQVNAVTRRSIPATHIDGTDSRVERFYPYEQASTPANPAAPLPQLQTLLYSFTAVGDGRAFITVVGDNPFTDPAMRLYDNNGNLLTFNDNFGGQRPQISASLIGGNRYFVVVDKFQNGAGNLGTLHIETDHSDSTSGVDDHVDSPVEPTLAASALEAWRQFAQATPISFSDPFLTLDADGNPVRDRGLRVSGSISGRIHTAGDRDLFKFTAPADMLNVHAGNDDDQGTALYIGGAFDTADPNTPFPIGSRNVTIWDAADYWYTGRQNNNNGFRDNPATPGTTRPEVYAMLSWDHDDNAQTPAILVVGGDFELQAGNDTFTNLALWRFNPQLQRYVWAAFPAAVDGPVHALTVTTVDDSVPTLFVGGDFETPGANVFGFNTTDGLIAVPGVDGPVFALAGYDAPDPGPGRAASTDPVLIAVADPEDPPQSLYIAGDFNVPGPINTAVLVWNGTDPAAPPQVGEGITGTDPVVLIRGVGRALAVFTDPDPDDDGPGTEQNVLYVGGEFEFDGEDLDGNPITGTNLASWGRPRLGQDVQAANYNPGIFWRAPLDEIGLTLDGAVLALQRWDPPDINNNTIDPMLVIGGEFTDHILGWDGVNPLDLGSFDATVRALTVLVDAQEPGVQAELDSGSPQQVLYVGGDFTEVTLGLDTVAVEKVAQFAANTGPGNPDDFFEYTALNNGVTYTDQTLGPASVFALANFDDGIAGQFDRHDRPATRLGISVSGSEGSFINARVRVFDSNFNLVYGFERPGSETISPPFPDPAGMVDPSLSTPGRNTELDGIRLWGGETYYIEVSDYQGTDQNPTARGGTGRYTLNISVDAGPIDVNGDGTIEDINFFFPASEEPNEGRFAQASLITTALANGDGTIVRNTASQLAGNTARTRRVNPSTGNAITMRGDQGIISFIDDTDLYTFEAEFTGTVEVRTSTLFIADQYHDAVGTTIVASAEKTYRSSLDTMLRIFRNDFTQIAFNDDTATTRVLPLNLNTTPEPEGEASQAYVGTLNRGTTDTGAILPFAFSNRDSRVVFNVVAGERYFIQVESGQRYKRSSQSLPHDANDLDNPNRRLLNVAREIDWREATGSYQLLVNQMPAQATDIENGVPTQDDHIDAFQGATNAEGQITQAAGNRATPIAIDETLGGLANGTGSITGVINNTPNQPNDRDVFRFTSIGTGAGSVTLSRTPGSTLNATITLLDANGNLVALGTPGTNGSRVLNFTAQKGQEFILLVTGEGGSEGGYRVDVRTPSYTDDHANIYKWWNATDLTLRDFQGRGTATGNIETPGDTDVFRFRFDTSERLTFSVTPLDASLTPRVTVYEVQENGLNQPYFARIGTGVLASGGANAQTTVSIYPRRLKEDPDTPRDYPYYYVVVEDADPQGGFGRYRLDVTFPATDDHADSDTNLDGVYDTDEFAFATPLLIDPPTGLGTASGVIELLGDTDLFRMTAASTGTLTITVNRATGSTIRPRLTVLTSSAAILAQSTGDDVAGDSTATITMQVTRGQQLWISVEAFNDAGTPNINSADTGGFTMSITAPALDDHPNATEWSIATAVTLNSNTGRGQIGGDTPNDPANARISPLGDTDLFTFTVIRAGSHTITITPFNATSGNLATRVSLYISTDQTTPLITTTSSGPASPVIFTIPGALLGARYFILVEGVVVGGSTATGEYNLVVAGPPAGGGGGGDGPDAIDYDNPTIILLNARTGDGSSASNTTNPQPPTISPALDRDLYAFTTAAAGRVFVRLSTPQGSLLRASVEVQRRTTGGIIERVAFDQDGVAGAIGSVSFGAGAGEQYYILVDGLGDSTGTYLIEVDTQPASNRLFYPEGYATDIISEFVPIVNPNPFPIQYVVRLRYDRGPGNPTDKFEDVFPARTIGANTRDGVTINAPIDGSIVQEGPVLQNIGYAILIEWTVPTVNPLNGQPIDPATIQPLGATISHYDFGSSTGDAFTETLSSRWIFARVERDPGAVLDFIPVFNPNNFAVNMWLDVYLSNGTVVTVGDVDGTGAVVPRRIDAGRRSGFGINDYPQLGRGVFSVVLRTAPVNPADEAEFEGVVAAITHYKLGQNNAAFTAMGDPSGGTTKGVFTNVTAGGGVTPDVVFFNPGTTPASITLTGTYTRASLPSFSRVIDVAPGRTVRLTGASLGLVAGQTVGFRYASNVPVVGMTTQEQLGDADGATQQNAAGTKFYFGDAFINSFTAGSLYFETLYFYNPAPVVNNVTVTLRFFNRGNASDAVRTINVAIPSGGFSEVRLHERAEVTRRADGSQSGATWFGIEASSIQPFVVNMTHYDLFLGGGWAAAGVPFGIKTPLSAIS